MTFIVAMLLAVAAAQSGQVLTDSGGPSAPADPAVVAAQSIGSNGCPAVRIGAGAAASRSIAAYARSRGWAVEALTPTYIIVRFGPHADEGTVTTFFRKLLTQAFGVTSAPNVMLREGGATCPTSSIFFSDKI